MMNVAPDLFKRYGDIIRVSRCNVSQNHIESNWYQTAPNQILVAEKNAIQKILVEDDFRKSPDYEAIREDPNITSLISETDKVKYKHRVSKSCTWVELHYW